MRVLTTAIIGALVAIAGCEKAANETADHEQVTPASTPADALVDANPLRNAYFGDLHVHTQNSFDAYVFGVRRTPDDAYRFAKGESIPHDGGGTVQLDNARPLDFYAVTDHGEYLGVTPAMADPNHPLSQTATAKSAFGAGGAEQGQTFFKIGLSFVTQNPIAEIYDRDWVRKTWQDTTAAADAHYIPGQFTTFSGYEFTAMRVVDSEGGGAANLHRNVIFEDKAPEDIFTTLTSGKPADLWAWMDKQRADGLDVLAIPHNSNSSNGMMFSLFDDEGNPVSQEALASRQRNEPLVEITQIKGTSDTRPVFSPNDEWADFEHYPYLIGSTLQAAVAEGGYVRPTLGLGVATDSAQGVNPFDFGLIGSSDSHIGAGNYTEANYSGKFPADGSGPEKRGSVPKGDSWSDVSEPSENGERRHVGATAASYSASGLAGVWAESNTREAIFAALQRKETFGTTGPRMRVRFFAGDYADDIIEQANLVETAYANGVAMGGKLMGQSTAPTLLVWAVQDPQSAPLDRAQVIKVWRNEAGGHQEKIFDAVCSSGAQPDPATYRCPANGSSVDISTCATDSGLGKPELKAAWVDPEFESEQSAVYYLRVLENPTCRWSTWDAVRNGTPPNPALPTTLQERAWSSPIWIN